MESPIIPKNSASRPSCCLTIKGSSNIIPRPLTFGRENLSTTAPWSPTFASLSAMDVSPPPLLAGTISTCRRASAITTLLLQSEMAMIATLIGKFISLPVFFRELKCVNNMNSSDFQQDTRHGAVGIPRMTRGIFRIATGITLLQALAARLSHHVESQADKPLWAAGLWGTQADCWTMAVLAPAPSSPATVAACRLTSTTVYRCGLRLTKPRNRRRQTPTAPWRCR